MPAPSYSSTVTEIGTRFHAQTVSPVEKKIANFRSRYSHPRDELTKNLRSQVL